jgi:hypothetical protein
MNARSMNPKAVVAAAMMMAAVVANGAASASPNAAHAVPTRTVMMAYQGAWTSPCAVVLKSAAAWNAWNQDMVARGMALAAEPAPANVDWKKEAVLVVSLGLMPGARMTVGVASADRQALSTDVELSLNTNQGGSAPCVVVAMDKTLAGQVQLVNAAAMGLPSMAQEYAAAPAMASGTAAPAGNSVAATWGEVKSAYRQ